MKKTRRPRPLKFEQLEDKSAPSSVLLVATSYDSASYSSDEPGNPPELAVHKTQSIQYETNQILRFIEDNSPSNMSSDRQIAWPTVAECAVADEMMEVVASEWSSLLVLSFYDGGSEL